MGRNSVFIVLAMAIALGSACKNKEKPTRIVNDSRTAQTEGGKKDTDMLPSVIVDASYQYEAKPTFRIKSCTIEGDILTIAITYKNGCDDSFTLHSSGMYLKSLPMQVNVFLERTNGKGACEDNVEQTLKFNVSALKHEGQAKLIVTVNSPENKVEYVY